MKLRGLSPSTIVIAVATLMLLGTLFLRGRKSPVPDDMKSQLTSENTAKNAPQNLKSVIAANLQKQEEMTERKDFDDSALLDRERQYTEKEINDMPEEEFKSLVKETELKLPKLSDIKNLPPAALHRTPAPVMQAGKDLGLLKEVLKVHESYEGIAAVMYQSCAKDSARPTPVRALCLTDLIQYKKKIGEKINKAEYPANLIDLTKMITDM
ncbi:MAG: hypothetical protein H7336_01635 [Bacteriovorax sp.]|nr:hypothetical protein [Bacteriovorax sp.]